jgi:hypothetical protein
MDPDMKNLLRKRKKFKCVPFLSLLCRFFLTATNGPASRFCHWSGFLLSEKNKVTILWDVTTRCCAWFLLVSFFLVAALGDKNGTNREPV